MWLLSFRLHINNIYTTRCGHYNATTNYDNLQTIKQTILWLIGKREKLQEYLEQFTE